MHKNETPMVLIYRHDDADGLWSGAIVYNMFIDNGYSAANISDIPVNYNKDSWNEDTVNKASYVYVLDFTFEDMDKLAEVAGNKLIWIDHHKTAMEKFPDLWNSKIEGKRSVENAGCTLTWLYCYPTIIVPNSVNYIADRDMWKFEYGNTKPFCEAAYVKIKSIFDSDITKLLNWDLDEDDLEYQYIEFGKARLDEQALRVSKAFERGSDIKFNNCAARIVNTTGDISEIGQFIYTKPEYDLAIMWYVDGSSVKFSLRSNSKDKNAPDCAEIAEKYGGGGHFNASGMTVRCEDFYTKLFNIENT